MTTAPADTAPASQPLRLEAGRYYRTRDGRKVGPMCPWPHSDSHPWTEDAGGRVYETDGTPWNRSENAALVAEWTDPAPSPVRTVTIQRTEVVPGTYGIVYVMASGYMGVLERNDYTPTELRAAAAALTEIAQGLDKIAAERNAE